MSKQCTLIPIRKVSQLSELSKLNKQNSLLSLSLIAKISLHKLYCTSKFLSTTHGIPNKGKAHYPVLNKDQQQVFEYIKILIVTSNRDGLLIFLDAPGGTGKTFTLNVLLTWMITKDLKVATSAASGIAATLLFLGQTSHHRFKLPITPHKD